MKKACFVVLYKYWNWVSYYNEFQATAASLSSSGQTGYEAHEDDDVEEMNDDAIDAKVLDDDIQQWLEEKLKREQHM